MDGWTTAADVERTKPHPDLVAAGLEKAGGGPGVMVGDSTWDCEAARRCGIPTIGLLTGGFSEQELIDAGAEVVFESIAAIDASADPLASPSGGRSERGRPLAPASARVPGG